MCWFKNDDISSNLQYISVDKTLFPNKISLLHRYFIKYTSINTAEKQDRHPNKQANKQCNWRPGEQTGKTDTGEVNQSHNFRLCWCPFCRQHCTTSRGIAVRVHNNGTSKQERRVHLNMWDFSPDCWPNNAKSYFNCQLTKPAALKLPQKCFFQTSIVIHSRGRAHTQYLPVPRWM